MKLGETVTRIAAREGRPAGGEGFVFEVRPHFAGGRWAFVAWLDADPEWVLESELHVTHHVTYILSA